MTYRVETSTALGRWGLAIVREGTEMVVVDDHVRSGNADLTVEIRTGGRFDPCIGGGSSRDCERGECNARAMCAAADYIADRGTAPHPTCIDVTGNDQEPRSEWTCGPDCPEEA